MFFLAYCCACTHYLILNFLRMLLGVFRFAIGNFFGPFFGLTIYYTNFICEGFMVSFLLCVMATGKFVIMDHGFSIYLVKVQLATTLVSCVGRGFGY